jgi:hypothetical protein
MATTITLTPDQHQTLLQAQKMLHDLLPDIDALEQCGKDCQDLRSKNDAIRAQITALQTQFGGPNAGRT